MGAAGGNSIPPAQGDGTADPTGSPREEGLQASWLEAISALAAATRTLQTLLPKFNKEGIITRLERDPINMCYNLN